MARFVMSLLRLLAVLLVAGVVVTHALPAVHHGSTETPAVRAPDVLTAATPHHEDVAGAAQSDEDCDLACQTRRGVVMLCLGGLAAAIAFSFLDARATRVLVRRVRPPPPAVTHRRLPLLRPPDPVAELCISRT